MTARLSVLVFATLGLLPNALAAPDDPYLHSTGSWGQTFADQWALGTLRVYVDVAPEQPPPLEPVIVAVIDTGLDYTHEDLAAERLWHNPNEQPNRRDDDGNGYVDDLIGWNFVDGTNNPWDQSGHGTHIAGIIGACTDNGVGVAAIARHVRIMPLKVANFAGQARSSAVAAAIDYAVAHGARIINLSLGGELVTDLERDAARDAAEQGVLIVVSAGNRGLAADRFGYPSLPDVLVVGASDPNDDRAGFSNFGAAIDVVAPGVDVLSLRARDTDFIAVSDPPDYPPGAAFVGDGAAYYRATGTSFAAASVSGTAAALLTLRPELDAAALKRLLAQTAVDVDAPGTDQRTGYGRVDFVRAAAAPADAFIEARMLGADLALDGETLLVQLNGIADAARFDQATIDARANPASVPATPASPAEDLPKNRKKQRDATPSPPSPTTDWQPLLPPLTTPVRAGALATVSLDTLRSLTGSASSWELRLTVTTTAGERREAFMAMALPTPSAAAAEQSDD